MTRKGFFIVLGALVVLLLPCMSAFIALLFIMRGQQLAAIANNLLAALYILGGCDFALVLVVFGPFIIKALQRGQPSNLWLRAGLITSFTLLGFWALFYIADGILFLVQPQAAFSPWLVLGVNLLGFVPGLMALIGKTLDARARQQASTITL